MEWHDAKELALRQWRGLLEGIGRRDVTTIVIELNEFGALCEKAREDAGSDAERCAHCIVFGDARSCASARFEITQALLSGELDEARAGVQAIVARIESAEALRVG